MVVHAGVELRGMGGSYWDRAGDRLTYVWTLRAHEECREGGLIDWPDFRGKAPLTQWLKEQLNCNFIKAPYKATDPVARACVENHQGRQCQKA